jgi:hypothetical protein
MQFRSFRWKPNHPTAGPRPRHALDHARRAAGPSQIGRSLTGNMGNRSRKSKLGSSGQALVVND